MKQLFSIFEPTGWAQLSSFFWFGLFIAIVIYVYWPRQNQQIDRHANIPLNDDGKKL